jgi:hypothetical protein
MYRKIIITLMVAITTALSAQTPKKPATKPDGKNAEAQETKTAANEQDRKIEVLAQEIEKLKAGKDLFPQAKEQGRYGLGPAASKVYEINQGVSIGGYGEFLYQRFAGTNQSGNDSNKSSEFDTLRTVFYFGYKFNDKIVFNSEVEIEHAGRSASTTASGGTPSHSHAVYKPEVYAEFANLDFMLHPMLNIKAGLMLVPMGIYNEMHEAPTFLATTRPLTEQRVIPSTWRENGAGIFGQIWDIAYKLYAVTSLDAKSSVDGFNSQGLRGGRQSGQKAVSNEFSAVFRADYVGIPGTTFGASGYWGKSGQADNHEHETTIVDAHADIRMKGIYLRGVMAYSQVTGANKLASAGIGLADAMYGAYIEVGYDVFRFLNLNQELFPHIRIERIDTQYKVAAGNRFDAQYEQNVFTFGVAYKPIHQISAKIDYSIYSNKADTGVNQLNFALGYLF